MNYSDNITIQKFIEQLVDALKYENTYRELNGKKLNIPFLLSALWQDLMDNYECYDEFCSDLRDCDNYDIVIGDDNYYICKVNIFLSFIFCIWNTENVSLFIQPLQKPGHRWIFQTEVTFYIPLAYLIFTGMK